MADEVRTWHWRNTMKPVRFLMLDSRCVIFVMLTLMHFREWTVGLLAVVSTFFWLCERKGLSFAAAFRAIRVWLIGGYRPAWIFTRRRKMTDTGST